MPGRLLGSLAKRARRLVRLRWRNPGLWANDGGRLSKSTLPLLPKAALRVSLSWCGGAKARRVQDLDWTRVVAAVFAQGPLTEVPVRELLPELVVTGLLQQMAKSEVICEVACWRGYYSNLGAWALDFLHTEAGVRAGILRRNVEFRAVPNATFGRLANRAARHRTEGTVEDARKWLNDTNVGNIYETYATCLLARGHIQELHLLLACVCRYSALPGMWEGLRAYEDR